MYSWITPLKQTSVSFGKYDSSSKYNKQMRYWGYPKYRSRLLRLLISTKEKIVNCVRVYNLDRLYRKCLLLSRVWLTPVSEAYVLLPQHQTLLFQENNWDSQWPLLANWFIGYIIQRRRYLISWDLCKALVLAEPSWYLIDEIKCPSIVP